MVNKNKERTGVDLVVDKGSLGRSLSYRDSVESVFALKTINYDAPVLIHPVTCRRGTVDLEKLFPGESVPNLLFRDVVRVIVDVGVATLTSCRRPGKAVGGRRSLHQVGRALDIQLDFLDGHHDDAVITTLVQRLLMLPAVSMIYTGRSRRGNVIMHVETHSPLTSAETWYSTYKKYHGRRDEFLRS